MRESKAFPRRAADRSPLVSAPRSAGRPRRLLQQRHGREADHQPDPDDPEGVAVGHDIGFPPHLRGDEAERLVLGGDEAAGVCAERRRQAGEPRLRQRGILRHRLGEHGKVEMLAPVDHRRQHRDPDRAAEVAHHVGERRGIGGVARAEAGRRHLRQRHGEERLPRRAQELRQDQLVHADVMRQVDVDEAARGKQNRAGDDEQARIEPFHQQRIAGNRTSCGRPLHMTT